MQIANESFTFNHLKVYYMKLNRLAFTEAETKKLGEFSRNMKYLHFNGKHFSTFDLYLSSQH